jgi:predicted nucleic acid-binding protein
MNLGARSHRFWPADISLADAVKDLRISLSGHQQVTDAYLLALACHHNGKLATLDRSLASLLPPDSPHQKLIELIQ